MAEQLPDSNPRRGCAGSGLPSALLAKANRSSGGEVAWREEDIAEAHEALADAGYAIAYGDVWAILLGKYVWEWPPTNPKNVVLDWQTDDRQPGQPWADYAHRVAQESLAKLTSLHVQDIVDREKLDAVARETYEKVKEDEHLAQVPFPAWEIYYSLGFYTEEEYEAFQRQHRT